jgi:transposase
VNIPKRPPEDAKAQALRAQGTFNPRPRAVKDELFADAGFFDPRDLVQVKYEMLRRVEKDGHSISEAAEAFGSSRPSFYQAQTVFQSGGLGGLVPLKRGPRQAHKLTPEIMDFILEVRRDHPDLRTADLVTRIRERFDLTVHPRSIERGLARHQKKRRTQQ